MKTDKFIYIGTTSKRIIRLWKNGSKDDAIQLRGIENLFSHCNKDVKLSFCGKLKINVSQEDCYGCGMKDKIQTARLFLDCYQIMMEEI